MIETNTDRWIYEITWYTPYSEPPNGEPRILAWGQSRFPGPDPEMKKEVSKYIKKNYKLVIVLMNPDPVLMPAEKLAEMRRKRKMTEFSKKYPLLASQMLRGDMAKRPDYYSVEGCQRHQNVRRKVIDQLNADFARKFPPDREIVLPIE